MSKPHIVTLDIDSVHEINAAYERAIEKFISLKQEAGSEGDIWQATIKLDTINFQSNFRRTRYECVFHITDRDWEGQSNE